MLSTSLAVVFVLVLALLLVAASRPKNFRVQRSRHIDASPEVLYVFISDLHRWPAWSPWEKLDSAMQRGHGGAPSGVGARYEWSGNNKVGAGRMEVLAAEPPSRVVIKLDFLRPFKASNTAEFTLAGEGTGTTVTWALYGPSLFVSRLMGLFLSMDRILGLQFEQGLSDLAALAEGAP